MPSIDERVVAMAFENAKFESGVATTLRTLDKLNHSLANVGRNNGLAEIEKSANKVRLEGAFNAIEKLRSKFHFGEAYVAFGKIESAADKVTLDGPNRALDKLRGKFGQAGGIGAELQGIEKSANKVTLATPLAAVDQLTAKLSAVQVAAGVALGALASKAAGAVAQLGQQLTGLQAIQEGFADYETKVGATQTIMAGTGDDIKTVSKYLKELDKYADETIYSLTDMTKNIGKFTNAGVDLKTSVGALKGISNVAALSGANTEEAARSMYNFGQAIGAGTVRMADWRSIDLANMGTKEFKEQLIEAALATGTLKKGSDGVVRSLKGNEVNFKTFGQTLQDQWLTSEALVNTLNKYADKTTDLGKRAYAAATDVKTFSMMITTLGAAAGTGWTDTFEIMFGNLPEATKLWTGLTTAIGGVIGKSAEMRNKVLKDWKDLGGRELLIENLGKVFSSLGAIFEPVRKAFRDIFPRKTGEDLLRFTKAIGDIADKIKPSAETVDNLRHIFRGLFAVLHIGWEIVKQTGEVIAEMLTDAGVGTGGILAFAAGIGDWLTALDQAISKGDVVKDVFARIADAISRPVEMIKLLKEYLSGIFSGDVSGGAALADLFGNLENALAPLAPLANTVVEAWKKLVEVFERVSEALQPVFDRISEEMGKLGDIIAGAFSPGNFDKTMTALQTGFLGGILVVLQRFKQSIGLEIGGGMFEQLNEAFGALTGNLKAMQKNVQADTILKIAIAIGVLAGAIYIIGQIDTKDLGKAMTTIAIGLGEMAAAFSIMSKGGVVSWAIMPLIAAALVGMATAILILSGAMKVLGSMDWEDLAKGLIGIGGGIAAIGTSAKLLGPSLIIQGPALILMAIGLNILALAVRQFGSMDLPTLAKGILGMATAIEFMGAAMKFMGPSLLIVGPGLILAAIGVNALAIGVAAFGNLDFGTLVKGILGAAAAIVALGLATAMLPPTLAIQAAGLVVLGMGLTSFAVAIGILGSMKTSTIAKGIIAMGAALIVLGDALYFMAGTLPGAAALLAAAAALVLLGPAIGVLGTLSWGTILTALAAMALTIGVLAIAGALAAAPLTALAIALGALGLAMTLVTTPIYILAKALQLLGATGAKGFGVMIAALTAFVAVLPKIVIDFVKGVLEIAVAVAKLAPEIVSSIGIIIGQFLQVVIDAAPKLAVATVALLSAFLLVINSQGPRLIDTGIKIVGHFLEGVAKNVGKLTAAAGNIVVKFLEGLRRDAPRITGAGLGTILAFVGGLNTGIPKVVAKVAETIARFLGEVTRHIPKIIGKGAELILTFIRGIGSKIGEMIGAGVRLVGQFVVGVGKAIPNLVKAGLHLARKFLNGLADGLSGLADIAFKAIIRFLNGLEKAIRENFDELFAAGAGVADAIVDGLTSQFGKAGAVLRKALESVFKLLPGWAKKVLGIKSPSTVFAEIGKHTMMGMEQGLKDGETPLKKSVEGIGNGVIGAFKSVFQIRSPSQVMKDIGKEVGRGFAEGLKGSQDDIRDSFSSMNERIDSEIDQLRGNIKTQTKDLAELNKHPKKNAKEIRELSTAMRENRADLYDLIEARGLLSRGMAAEKGRLLELSGELKGVTEKLEDAKQALDSILNDRKAFIESTRDRFASLPDFDSESKDPVADYKKKLADQVEATKKFYETMKTLRAKGLDDTTFKKLLEGGLQNADFAEALSTDDSAIKSINEMNTELLAISTQMGEDFGTSLYAVGVKAAEGLVKGLEDRKVELERVMQVIADALVARIKSALGIKSPSKVFADIGKFASEGLAKGFKDSATMVAQAAANLGTSTVTAMQNTIADISKSVAENITAEPVITPVLDLTQVKKDASTLGDLTNVTPITAATSYGQASAISAEQAAALTETAAAASVAPTVNFEQNNYSPEALSAIEIYRQTNNQVAQLKSLVGLPA